MKLDGTWACTTQGQKGAYDPALFWMMGNRKEKKNISFVHATLEKIEKDKIYFSNFSIQQKKKEMDDLSKKIVSEKANFKLQTKQTIFFDENDKFFSKIL